MCSLSAVSVLTLTIPYHPTQPASPSHTLHGAAVRLRRNLTSSTPLPPILSAPLLFRCCTSTAVRSLGALLNLDLCVRESRIPSARASSSVAFACPLCIDSAAQSVCLRWRGSPLQRLIAASLALTQTPSIRLYPASPPQPPQPLQPPLQPFLLPPSSASRRPILDA